jgi:non-canonical purine NTP pyrophosphatase (RdgB/HAM1 family)
MKLLLQINNMPNLTFITGNKAKAEQLAFHLDVPVAHQKLDLVEIQSLNLEEVVRDKVTRAYELLGTPVLVEDASLSFNALGNLPGPLIKWFLQEVGNEGLCRILDGKDRSATGSVAFAIYNGKDLHIFTGEAQGSIATTPRGEHGFGWDPVFIPAGHDTTWAEMTLEEQASTSMRRPALLALKEFLETTPGW